MTQTQIVQLSDNHFQNTCNLVQEFAKAAQAIASEPLLQIEIKARANSSAQLIYAETDVLANFNKRHITPQRLGHQTMQAYLAITDVPPAWREAIIKNFAIGDFIRLGEVMLATNVHQPTSLVAVAAMLMSFAQREQARVMAKAHAPQ